MGARHRGGFTLLEMLMVGMLGIIISAFVAARVAVVFANDQRLAVANAATKELKIATEAIAQDYGPAIASRTVDDEVLQLNIDGAPLDGVAAWDSPDTVIEYPLVNGRLIRRDLSSNTEVPIAAQISAMQAATVHGKVEVHLGRRGSPTPTGHHASTSGPMTPPLAEHPRARAVTSCRRCCCS